MWLKIEDGLLIAVLEAMPRPWRPEAVAIWLRYAHRCVEPAAHGLTSPPMRYWVPRWASSTAHGRSRAGKLPGRSSVESVAGVGPKTAQRLLELAAANRKGSVDDSDTRSPNRSGDRSGDPVKEGEQPRSENLDRSGTRSGDRSGDRSGRYSGASTPAPRKQATAAVSRDSSSRTEKSRELNKGTAGPPRRRGRSRVNLATAPPPSRPVGSYGDRPQTAADAVAAWQHVSRLFRAHSIMPVELHRDPLMHGRIYRALTSIGGGVVVDGWSAMSHRAMSDDWPDMAPAEWVTAYTGGRSDGIETRIH